jgi:uncharacterized protein YndB with AHSA1/START domain
MDKIISKNLELNCTPATAYRMFITKDYLKKWLSLDADVEAEVGGKYELFWDLKDRQNDSTLGCKILALIENKLLNFEWKGAKQFKHFMNEKRPLTNVTVIFYPSDTGCGITLLHTGWGNTDEWENAYNWFENAWSNAFSELKNFADSQ